MRTKKQPEYRFKPGDHVVAIADSQFDMYKKGHRSKVYEVRNPRAPGIASIRVELKVGGLAWVLEDNWLVESMITLNQHDQIEFGRAAQAMYERGENEYGHILSVAATKATLPLTEYDQIATIYRDWLVFNEPKPVT